MNKMKSILLSVIGILAFLSNVNAENLAITNVQLVNKDVNSKEVTVQFDISWGDSWRNTTNHDASWIFVKHRVNATGEWKHTKGFKINPSVSYTIRNTSDSMGLFISRNVDGTGVFTANSVQITWNYGDHNILDNDNLEVYVGGVEMVYVPEGSFYIGDGSAVATFRNVGSNTPYLITGENSISLGGSNASNLTVEYYQWDTDPDFFTSEQQLPASFPKGFQGFYCMKYELSQGLVTDFLNRISETQATYHTTGSYINAEQGNPVRNGQSRNTIDGTYPNFTCSAPYRPCGFIRHWLFMAMADWTGLRPMSEMEWEKACRGSGNPLAGEYAWGTTSFVLATGTVNDGTLAETSLDNTANTNNAIGYENYSVDGPIRSGWQDGTTREELGTSYWGIRDMTGNLWERAITINSATGRLFDGSHGDGTIDASGNPDVQGWPDVHANPHNIGHRGGAFNLYAQPVSERTFSTGSSGALGNYGGRFVRSHSTVNVITSLGQNDINNNWEMYPNPAKSTLHFSEKIIGNKVEIVDVMGALMYDAVLETNSVSVEFLTPGIYFIRIGSGNLMTKFIKQ